MIISIYFSKNKQIFFLFGFVHIESMRLIAIAAADFGFFFIWFSQSVNFPQLATNQKREQWKTIAYIKGNI